MRVDTGVAGQQTRVKGQEVFLKRGLLFNFLFEAFSQKLKSSVEFEHDLRIQCKILTFLIMDHFLLNVFLIHNNFRHFLSMDG